MKTETEGLILMNRAVGDKNRLLTILTRDCGVLGCFIRGANRPGSSNFSATQPLTYSRLSIFRGRNSYTVDEAKIICTFFEPGAMDMLHLALIQYFCELVMKIVPENTDASQPLDLLLNCLHLLKKGRPPLLVKTVFEIRLAAISGWMPHLLYCEHCGAYEDETMYFYYQENVLRCQKCYREGSCCPLSKGALTAFRYVVSAEPKKAFSFQVSEDTMRQLSECAERYILAMTATHFHTLDYYHQVAALES